MYHGSPSERAELRRTDMNVSLLPEGYHQDEKERAPEPDKVSDSEEEEPTPKKRGGRGRGKGRGTKRRAPPRKAKEPAPKAEEDKPTAEGGEMPHESEETVHARALENKFPVVVTTYEMIIKDRAHLARYRWGFIVVDEGHRLKNMDCKLMQEIKQYESAGRMVLTGTPLQASFIIFFCRLKISSFQQNNLAELWSLLNFILPDVFSDLHSFQDWYIHLLTLLIPALTRS